MGTPPWLRPRQLRVTGRAAVSGLVLLRPCASGRCRDPLRRPTSHPLRLDVAFLGFARVTPIGMYRRSQSGIESRSGTVRAHLAGSGERPGAVSGPPRPNATLPAAAAPAFPLPSRGGPHPATQFLRRSSRPQLAVASRATCRWCLRLSGPPVEGIGGSRS